MHLSLNFFGLSRGIILVFFEPDCHYKIPIGAPLAGATVV